MRLFTRLLLRTFPRAILRLAPVLRHADRPQRTLLALSQARAGFSRPCWPRLTSIQNCLSFAINGVRVERQRQISSSLSGSGRIRQRGPFFLRIASTEKNGRMSPTSNSTLRSLPPGRVYATTLETTLCPPVRNAYVNVLFSLRRLDVRTVDLSCPAVCHIHHGRTVVSQLSIAWSHIVFSCVSRHVRTEVSFQQRV